MASRAKPPVEDPTSATESDEDLGVGTALDHDDAADGPAAEQVAQPTDMTGALAALLASPQGQAMVEAAVNARMAQMGVSAPAMNGQEKAFSKFLENMERMLETRESQQPGHVRPLTEDEIKDRLAGQTRMLALIRLSKIDNIWPEYVLTDVCQLPSPAGPRLYPKGQTVNWRGAPNENMQPTNQAAAEIYSSYKQWIGEVVSVEELLRYATSLAAGGQPIPQAALVRVGAEDIQVVDSPIIDVSPKHILGTNGPEARNMKPGQGAAAPSGPVFVES